MVHSTNFQSKQGQPLSQARFFMAFFMWILKIPKGGGTKSKKTLLLSPCQDNNCELSQSLHTNHKSRYWSYTVLCLHKDESPTPPSPDLKSIPLTVNVQTGSEDSCLQIVIPPASIKHNSGDKVGCRVREQEYHQGTLRAKSSRTYWGLGERHVWSPLWDEMLQGWQAGERNFCWRPGSCCLDNGRLRDVTYFQRMLLSALTSFRLSSCSSF